MKFILELKKYGLSVAWWNFRFRMCSIIMYDSKHMSITGGPKKRAKNYV